jgi:hypothetical protein
MARIRALRRSSESHRALAHRKRVLLFGIALALGIIAALALLLEGCGGGATSSGAIGAPAASSTTTLSGVDAGNIVQAAAVAASPTTMVIAVVDRAGNVLALYRKADAPATVAGNFGTQVD